MINKPTTLPRRIYSLPNHLANQIAAGEVVERPASAFKELLENSLDANSNLIEIALERGGIGLIRVQDNGNGICKEDLELALASHATSKIKTLSDLEGVISYGFRGEALASITSVSRLQLISCVENQETGYCIRMQGREGVSILEPTPKRQGTCVEVRDLFYNTPARRKFLKSEKTEMANLEEVFKRVALSQPQVAFKFRMDDRPEKYFPACKNLETQTRRLALLCGKSFVENAYYIQAESNGLKLFGWLASPKALRAQADLQYFYVNGRIVRDKVVSHAIRQAYQKICLPGRYPAYVLYFELDPAAVDVNVHPTKHEVRFREARTVHAFLSYAIQEGLEFKENEKKENAPEKAAELRASDVTEEREEEKSSQKISITPGIMQTTLPGLMQPQTRTEKRTVPTRPEESGIQNTRSAYKENFSFLDRANETSQTSETSGTNESRETKNEINHNAKNEAMSLLGTPLSVFGNEILLMEKNNELVLIDIKKLQKEVLRRKLLDAYRQEGIQKRLLLMPKTVLLGAREEDLESRSKDLDWERLGFEWNQVGPSSLMIRGVPELFGAKIEGLGEFFPRLLKLREAENCIDAIVDHIVKTQKLSLEAANQLLIDWSLEKHSENEKGGHPSHFYKKLTLEQLRLFLFGN